MVDTPQGETIIPAPLETNATPPAAPPAVNTVDNAEVERLRKEAEQAKMRTQQLENEKAAREKTDAEARQKQLEEQEQWKTLAQESQAKAESLEREKQEAERQRQLAAASSEVLKDYSDNVKSIAETAHLSLADDSDEGRTAFKAALDAIQLQVGPGAPTVTPNNPSAPVAGPVDREALVRRAGPGKPSPMAEAAAKGDDSVLHQYIGDLPAVKRMREIAAGN